MTMALLMDRGMGLHDVAVTCRVEGLLETEDSLALLEPTSQNRDMGHPGLRSR
jgi:hypothetical protein